jgi:hypothetical protein
MATCNNVTKIGESEFLASSLFKLNTNYSNLDKGLCELGKDLDSLRAFVRSLTVKDSPTVDMSFSLQSYAVSANVINDSLGTRKLGQDIPLSSKIFLTTTKLSSLADVEIDFDTLNLNNGLKWFPNKNKWLNSKLTDTFGAQWLYDLNDVLIKNSTKENNQVLKYNSSSQFWVNEPETGLSAIPNGFYEDITVQNGAPGLGPNGVGGQGTLWKLNESSVTSWELASLSVATSSISALQVTNDKFADRNNNNGGIPISKFAFDLGEVNRGINVGTGTGKICLETNDGTKIPIKTLKGVNCSIISENDRLVIYHQPWETFPGWPPARIPYKETPPILTYQNRPGGGSILPASVNLGTGSGVFSSPVQSLGTIALPKYNLAFKSLKAGSGITITTNSANTEINLTKAAGYMALTILGQKADGTSMTNADILSRLIEIYPPSTSTIPVDTICSVIVETINTSGPGAVSPSIPVTISYNYKKINVPGSIIAGGGGTAASTDLSLDFVTPDANWLPPAGGKQLVSVTAGPRTYQTTVTPAAPTIGSITRQILKYKKLSNNTWVLQP